MFLGSKYDGYKFDFSNNPEILNFAPDSLTFFCGQSLF